MLTIILFLSSYPIIPIMYMVLKNECTPQNNMVLGVTLPTDKLDNPKVKEILSYYTRLLKRITILLALIPLSTFFIHYDSITYSILMMWITTVFVALYIPLILCNRKLKALMEQENYDIEDFNNTMVEIKMPQYDNPKSQYYLFIPVLLISIIPVIIDLNPLSKHNTLSLIATIPITLITFLFLYIYKRSYKEESEVVSRNSIKNKNLAKIHRYYLRKYSIILAYINTLYIIPYWLYMKKKFGSVFWFLAFTLLYVTLMIYVMLQAKLKIYFAQGEYIKQNSNLLIDDDNQYWLLGLLYYNPNNTRTFIKKRNDTGSTINLAKTTGKIFAGIIIATILFLPISCVGMIQSEFSPLSLTIDEDSITASHLKTTYDLSFDHIKAIELWDKLPDTSKENGVDFTTLEKGRFSVAYHGVCTLCINPKNHYFLYITTNKDKQYVLSGKTDEVTKTIYKKYIEYTK